MVEVKGSNFSNKNLAWAIKNRDKLMKYVELSVIICFFSFIFAATVHLCFTGIFLIFMITGFLLYSLRERATKYHEIIATLGSDLQAVTLMQADTMKFTSKRYGEFYMRYLWGGESAAHYKIWIILDKLNEDVDGQQVTLWEKTTWPQRKFSTPPKLKKYVPKNWISQVNTLRRINIEGYDGMNIIVATLNDQQLSSETKDILRTVQILEYIWAKL
jgi:hypothetical protein